MGKRGNSFIVFLFLIILFILFFVLRSMNFVGNTGYAVNNGGLTVNDVYFVKTDILEDSSFRVVENATEFYKGDVVGCLFFYDLTEGSNATLSIGFYSKDKIIDNPDVLYSDILNIESDYVFYNESAGIALFEASEYKPGSWKCFALWDSSNKISNKIDMKNRAPILKEPVPPISLDIEGNYLGEGKLDLNNFFSDIEDDKLIYGAVGQINIQIFVDENGIVAFSNPSKWEGYESILFRAYDGELGTFSNNITIKVGSGTNQSGQAGCVTVWDCNWETCVNGKQNCVYFDRNNCGSDIDKPANLVRECSLSQPQQSPNDASKVIGGDLKNFNANVPVTIDTKRVLLILGLVVLILLIVSLGGYLLFSSRKKSSQTIKESKKEPENVSSGQVKVEQAKTEGSIGNISELRNYIISALKQGQKEAKIIIDLQASGWKKEDVDSGLNYAKLKIFVEKKLAQGINKDEIISTLKKKGWKDEMIKSIFEK